MKYAKRRKRILSVILTVLLLFIVVPVWWAFVIAFDRFALDRLPFPIRFWPRELSVYNFTYAFDMIPIWRYFFNTLGVTLSNTAISVAVSLMCGYAFAKGKFPFKKTLFMLILAVMMLPFESRLVPLFLQYRSWKMLNTYWPLILGGFAYAYGIFFARQNIDANIPDALRESAYLDGAGEWRIFLSIVVPLSGPLIATLCILQVLANWNAYLWPLVVISDSSKQLISVGVSLFNTSVTTTYYGPRLAVALISALPLVVLFLFFQKYIVASISISGIKQ